MYKVQVLAVGRAEYIYCSRTSVCTEISTSDDTQ